MPETLFLFERGPLALVAGPRARLPPVRGSGDLNPRAPGSEIVGPPCQDREIQFPWEGIMSADPPPRAIRCPQCGQENELDESMADQFTAPLRNLWGQEMHEQRSSTRPRSRSSKPRWDASARISSRSSARRGQVRPLKSVTRAGTSSPTSGAGFRRTGSLLDGGLSSL